MLQSITCYNRITGRSVGLETPGGAWRCKKACKLTFSEAWIRGGAAAVQRVLDICEWFNVNKQVWQIIHPFKDDIPFLSCVLHSLCPFSDL